MITAQSVHVPPAAPQVVWPLSAAAHLPLLSQQVPLHAVSPAAPQESPHWCVVVLHAEPEGQSPADVQPQVRLAPASAPERHAVPLAFPEQSEQTPAATPQVPCDVSAVTQVPLVDPPGIEQHAPLHCWLAVHVVTHVPPEHELPTGQSACELQPHAPLTQAWPLALFVQSMHAAPEGPHAVGLAPAAQVDSSLAPALQHDPLQASVAEHVVTHAFVPMFQAPPSQSPAPVQPHIPPPVVATQAAPTLVPPHVTHAPPLAPHPAVADRPVVQEPPVQHPPLHTVCAEVPHEVVHVCVVVSHA